MEFTISKTSLQKELGLVQGTVEKKNTIPALSNILIESVGDGTIRITGTDLDVTLRCETEAEIKTPGSMCVGARKLFDIARVLPDAPVSFRKEENNWATVKCERSNFRIAGIDRDNFPEVPSFKSAPVKLSAGVFKTLIDRTIFAITLEESRYTLSGAKFMLNKSGAKMVTTDGHRLAFVERKDLGPNAPTEEIDVLIPRKTLAELTKLTASYEGEIGLGADENHIYFEVGSHLLISRTLTGQFPNYDMVMPKTNDKRAEFDSASLGQAIRRVALMADDRSHAIRFHLTPGSLHISSQTAEEGEARETVTTEYAGEETEIGFNAAYLQDFLNVLSDGTVAFEFKDGNSQAQLRPASDDGYDYRYVVMPMRL
ncbi:MAG: polymerase subunit beta [Acidobacteriota bacterium]|jgi:DNA polymerase-3 subunit beta|nr:polymerase subunit beta [Acidobacteriota bacterium]MDT7780186.1 polymerase subunit beta [Acidobacteriota bacterium]